MLHNPFHAQLLGLAQVVTEFLFLAFSLSVVCVRNPVFSIPCVLPAYLLNFIFVSSIVIFEIQ